MGTPSSHETRFSKNVARVRKARGLSQDELATHVNLGRSAIQALETGDRRIRLGEACDLADALGVTLDQLIGTRPITIELTTTPADRIAFADAALALAGHEVTDPYLRAIADRVAHDEITGDEAVAAMRQYVQGPTSPA